MQLIRHGRFVDADSVKTLALHELETQRFDPGVRVATLTDADSDPAALLPWLDRLALIIVPFASFGDGRGFSTAVRLRRLGYGGELRARGELLADQYHHLRACGFDSVEISDALAARHAELDWHKAWRRFPDRYQPQAVGLGSILAQRHAAPEGSAPAAAERGRQTTP